MIDHTHKEAGFSLIEIAIVMCISGLLLVAGLRIYTVYQQKAEIERANILMATIDQTLTAFYKSEGRLPCPAPINGSAAGNNFDTENCGSGVRDVAGIGGGRVLIGKLPAATLGLGNEYMRDVHGSYLTYAVTQTATVEDGSVSGAIRVREENIDRAAGSATLGEIVEIENHTNITYVVLSHGKTRAGAYNHNGAQPSRENASKDGENADEDAVFRASLLSNGGSSSDSSFYDDRVLFKKDSDLHDGGPITLKRANAGDDFEIVYGGMGAGDQDVLTMKKDGYLHVRDYNCSGSGACHVSTGERSDMYPLKEGDVVAKTEAGNNDVLTVNGEPLSSTETANGDNFLYSTTSYGYDKAPELTGITYQESHGSGNQEESSGFATNVWVE